VPIGSRSDKPPGHAIFCVDATAFVQCVLEKETCLVLRQGQTVRAFTSSHLPATQADQRAMAGRLWAEDAKLFRRSRGEHLSFGYSIRWRLWTPRGLKRGERGSHDAPEVSKAFRRALIGTRAPSFPNGRVLGMVREPGHSIWELTGRLIWQKKNNRLYSPEWRRENPEPSFVVDGVEVCVI